MQNRPVWFGPGSIRVPCVVFAVTRQRPFVRTRSSDLCIAQEKFAIARRARQHAGRVRSPVQVAALAVLFAPIICLAQQPSPTASPVSRPTTSRGSKSYAGRKALCTDRELSQASFKFLPSRGQGLPASC